MSGNTRRSVLAGVAVLLLAAVPAGADLVQSGDLSLTDGNDLLPGTGISFSGYTWTGDGSNLNMAGYSIENIVNAIGFTLDMNGGNLIGGGTLTTARNLATGAITISNAGDIVVDTITTESTGSSTNAGAITITHSGNFTAASIVSRRTGVGTAGVSITGDDTGNFLVTGGIDSSAPNTTGKSGPVSIQDYVNVTVAGGILAYTNLKGSWGDVDIGAAGNRIGGKITVTGGIDTHSVNSSATVAGDASLYADGDVKLSGTINLRSNSGGAYVGILTLASTAGTVTLGDSLSGSTVLDLANMQYILFDSSTPSYLYYDLESFAAGTDPSTQIRVANAGQIVYYDPTVNADLALGGHLGLPTGQYNLTGGGFLVPVPEPATVAFLAIGGLAMAGGAAARRRRKL